MISHVTRRKCHVTRVLGHMATELGRVIGKAVRIGNINSLVLV